MKKIALFILICFYNPGFAQPGGRSSQVPSLQVKIANGILEGVDESGVRAFKGIPFAAPPVGVLRWREPQPVTNWTGVRKADKFGPRAMQLPVFSDMMFRSDGVSEDCLYLNVWTPAKTATDRLPVLVYFYGGGLIAGDGSEYRYDGEALARRGIVTLTVNYRLGKFGFFSHPELTRESPHKASGNYGFLDQAAALQWVQRNIAAFGGDPKRVTIAGESAGSYSVSAQMASPLARNLIAGAIGESGSLLGSPTATLAEAEKLGVEMATMIGTQSLAELRAISAQELLEATSKPGIPRFPTTVDGYFFPKSPVAVFAAGQQAQVPLLVGWNSQESGPQGILGKAEPTRENFTDAVKKMYGDQADALLKVYDAPTDADVTQTATDMAGDRFIGFGTWKWSDTHTRTGGKPVYRYLYAQPRPQTRAGGAAAKGASHSAEIEYALGNLPTNRVYDWQPEDYKVSEITQGFFANFVKTGDPNGLGVPQWPAVQPDKPATVMYIDAESKAQIEPHRARYLLLDELTQKGKK